MAALDEKQHSPLGASKAERWMNCPGSVALEAKCPEPPESPYAKEGTVAHHVAALALTGKHTSAFQYVMQEFDGIEVDDDMAGHVDTFVDHCRGLTQTRHWVEQSFNLQSLNPPAPMFGTADFVAYDAKSKTLWVVDLKFGKGVFVDATENAQLRYYGLGVLLELGNQLDVEKVVLTIVQPRNEGKTGAVRSEEIDVMDLLDFAGDLLAMARETQNPNAKLKVGDWCKFCKVAGHCPEQLKQAQLVAQTEFADLPEHAPPVPGLLPTEVFVSMLPHLPMLDQWMKAMYARAEAMLYAGEEVPGFKLVEKKANRSWTDPVKTEAWLREHPAGFDTDDIFTQKLKSPNQVEKLKGVGKKGIPDGYTEKKSAGYTMVDADDARPAVQITPGAEFPLLEAGEADLLAEL